MENAGEQLLGISHKERRCRENRARLADAGAVAIATGRPGSGRGAVAAAGVDRSHRPFALTGAAGDVRLATLLEADTTFHASASICREETDIATTRSLASAQIARLPFGRPKPLGKSCCDARAQAWPSLPAIQLNSTQRRLGGDRGRPRVADITRVRAVRRHCAIATRRSRRAAAGAMTMGRRPLRSDADAKGWAKSIRRGAVRACGRNHDAER